MRLRQWLVIEAPEFAAKAVCAGVCVPGSAHLCRAFSNIPTLNRGKGRVKTLPA